MKLPTGKDFKKLRKIVDEHKIHTICESGSCLNMGEFWSAGTATFMIFGNICTRSCGLFTVATGRPGVVDEFQPYNVARSVTLRKVNHCVVTSVDSDNLTDGGIAFWCKTANAIRYHWPATTIESLIPDFAGNWTNLQRIIDVAYVMVSHNLETLRQPTKQVRMQAQYDRSLEVLRRLKKGKFAQNQVLCWV